ncbi:unnamed protein product [Spirodela intermedia]|uniref:Uncharacterized protein n=1 Tax=Spirodela intermedia TaxID=51605 RepID=A0A7I8K928_SPIIN|nr:unnamed protein product [Spirodela intermedia]
MAEDTQASSTEELVKLPDAKVEELKKEDDEEDTALEREFIKVEKEPIDVKVNSPDSNSTAVKESTPPPDGKLEDANDKIKQLSSELQQAESEKARFQSEVSTSQEALQKSNKRCEELESDLKRLKEEMVEARLKHQSEVDSLQQAQRTQEAFDGLTLELERSKERVEKLEQDLSSSADELSRFKELSDEKAALADSESKRASELEKMLEAAKTDAKEMDSTLTLLREELKVLDGQVKQSQQAEEALGKTRLELEQKELGIQELKKEVDALSASEKQLGEEMAARDSTLKSYELQVLGLQEELQKASKERETLEITVGELENKLALSEQNLSKSDSLLTSAQSHSAELQERLDSLEELHKELGARTEKSTQEHLELNAELGKVKDRLKEAELKLVSVEERNVELEKQLNLAELKGHDDQVEIKKLRGKISELADLLKSTEEEAAMSTCHFQAYQERITQLESSAEKSSSMKVNLEKKLNEFAEKLGEKEIQASAAQDRVAELEELVKVASVKEEDSLKRIGDLELLLMQKSGLVAELSAELEAIKVKSVDLEREYQDTLNAVTEEKKKFKDLSEISAGKHSEAENLIEALRTELKSTNEKLQDVEKELEASGVRERETLEKLEHHGIAVEKATARSLELEALHESVSKDSERKLQEAISNLDQKDSETKLLTEKLKNLEEQAASHQEQAAKAAEKLVSLEAELEERSNKLVSLEARLLDSEKRCESSLSENKLLAETNQKLQAELEAYRSKTDELHSTLSSVHAEKDATAVQLALHLKAIDELRDQVTKVSQLHSETESRTKEAQLQLNEAHGRLTQRDSETQELNAKIHELESKIESYEEELRAAAASVEAHKSDLDAALSKLRALEGTIEEEKGSSSRLESENTYLVETNIKLTEELAAYEVKTSDLKRTLATLQEDNEKTSAELVNVASEGKTLQSQIASLTAQIEEVQRDHREKESSLNATMETLSAELKVKSDLQTRLVELEDKLSSSETQSREQIERIKSEVGEKEAELASMVKDHAEKLKEKDVLSENLGKLQVELDLALKRAAEQKEAESRKDLEQEATVKQLQGEVDAQRQHAASLEEQVNALKTQLHQYESQIKEKGAEVNSELEELRSKLTKASHLEEKIAELESKLQLASKKSEQAKLFGAYCLVLQRVETRDIGIAPPALSPELKRGQPSEAVSGSSATTAAEPSTAIALKFVLGVALVSVIVGVILGKRY